jgi:hypothetical protein
MYTASLNSVPPVMLHCPSVKMLLRALEVNKTTCEQKQTSGFLTIECTIHVGCCNWSKMKMQMGRASDSGTRPFYVLATICKATAQYIFICFTLIYCVSRPIVYLRS